MADPKYNDLFKPSQEGQSGPKGLERGLYITADFILKADLATRQILYGKIKRGEDSNKKPSVIDRALEKGLVKITDEISSIDFCGIINYLATQIGGKGFDPKSKRPDGGPGLTLWLIQNEAYNIQLLIDRTLGDIRDVATREGSVRLGDLMVAISNSIDNKINVIIEDFKKELKAGTITESDIANNESNYDELNRAFKKLYPFQIALQETSNVLQTIGANPTIGTFNKALNTINKTRQICILIQSITNPAAALSLANQVSGGAIQEQISRLNNFASGNLQDNVAPLLKKILSQSRNINSTAQKLLNQIKTIQFFIKTLLTVLKALRVIRRFFLTGFQVPNLYTTVAVTNTASNALQDTIKEQGIDKLILRLQQINFILSLIINFATMLVAAINQILLNLNAILLNVESCNPDLADEVKNTIDSLEATRNDLQAFLNSVDSSQKQVSRSYGDYIIEIITEQVVDEGINLKRRFGVAKALNGIAVVQSTPTFASLDLIIINEVKALLNAKGLVNVQDEGLTNDALLTISEAATYLGDESVTIENPVEVDVNIEESTELDLGNFADNLPGGRALRRRVRNKLIKNNEKLVQELRASGPSDSTTERLIQQKESETNKLKIQKLEDQKKDLQKLLLIPGASPLVLAKIKDIDNQINKLKNNQK